MDRFYFILWLLFLPIGLLFRCLEYQNVQVCGVNRTHILIGQRWYYITGYEARQDLVSDIRS